MNILYNISVNHIPSSDGERETTELLIKTKVITVVIYKVK